MSTDSAAAAATNNKIRGRSLDLRYASGRLDVDDDGDVWIGAVNTATTARSERFSAASKAGVQRTASESKKTKTIMTSSSTSTGATSLPQWDGSSVWVPNTGVLSTTTLGPSVKRIWKSPASRHQSTGGSNGRPPATSSDSVWAPSSARRHQNTVVFAADILTERRHRDVPFCHPNGRHALGNGATEDAEIRRSSAGNGSVQNGNAPELASNRSTEIIVLRRGDENDDIRRQCTPTCSRRVDGDFNTSIGRQTKATTTGRRLTAGYEITDRCSRVICDESRTKTLPSNVKRIERENNTVSMKMSDFGDLVLSSNCRMLSKPVASIGDGTVTGFEARDCNGVSTSSECVTKGGGDGSDDNSLRPRSTPCRCRRAGRHSSIGDGKGGAAASEDDDTKTKEASSEIHHGRLVNSSIDVGARLVGNDDDDDDDGDMGKHVVKWIDSNEAINGHRPTIGATSCGHDRDRAHDALKIALTADVRVTAEALSAPDAAAQNVSRTIVRGTADDRQCLPCVPSCGGGGSPALECHDTVVSEYLASDTVEGDRQCLHMETLSPEEILNWKLSLMTGADSSDNSRRRCWTDGCISMSDCRGVVATDGQQVENNSLANDGGVDAKSANDVIDVRRSPSANSGGGCGTCCSVSVFSFEDNFERALEESNRSSDDNEDDAEDDEDDVGSENTGELDEYFETQLDDLLRIRVDHLSVVGEMSIPSVCRSFDDDGAGAFDGNADRTRHRRLNATERDIDASRKTAAVTTSGARENGLLTDRAMQSCSSTSSGRGLHEVISSTSRDFDRADGDHVSTIIYRSLLGAFPSDERLPSFVVDEGRWRSTAARAFDSPGLSQTRATADDYHGNDDSGRFAEFYDDPTVNSSPEVASVINRRVAQHIPFSVCCIDDRSRRLDATVEHEVSSFGPSLTSHGGNSASSNASHGDASDDRLQSTRAYLAQDCRQRNAEFLNDRSTKDGDVIDIERQLNFATVRLVDGLVACLRRQSSVTDTDVVSPDGSSQSVMEASISDLRAEFFRSSMTAVVDEVNRRTHRLRNHYDRLSRLIEMGFDVRLDEDTTTTTIAATVVKKFVMTCQPTDDAYEVAKTQPDEVDVFVLRNGVRIDGLHVSAPANVVSQRGPGGDDGRLGGQVEVRQESDLQSAFDSAMRAIITGLRDDDDDDDDGANELGEFHHRKPQEQQQQQQQQQPQPMNECHSNVDPLRLPATVAISLDEDCLPPPPPDWSDDS